MSKEMKLIMENFRKFNTSAGNVFEDQAGLADRISSAIERHIMITSGTKDEVSLRQIVEFAADLVGIDGAEGPGQEFLRLIPDHGLGKVTATQITDALRNEIAPADLLVRLGVE